MIYSILILLNTYSYKYLYVFQAGVMKCAEVAIPLKEAYMEWSVLRCDLKEARKLYKRFVLLYYSKISTGDILNKVLEVCDNWTYAMAFNRHGHILASLQTNRK